LINNKNETEHDERVNESWLEDPVRVKEEVKKNILVRGFMMKEA